MDAGKSKAPDVSSKWMHPGKPPKSLSTSSAGLTLLEIMFAFTVFVVILAFTAQALINFFGMLSLQQQRNSALTDCRAVLSAMRQISYRPEATDDCPGDAPLFPCVLFMWSAQFPQTAGDAAEDAELLDTYGRFFSLPEQRFLVDTLDEAGDPAVISPALNLNTNPVYVTVTTFWTGFRGREYSVSLATVITDR